MISRPAPFPLKPTTFKRINITFYAFFSFLLEVGDDTWVDIGCLILSDMSRGIYLTGYTQPTTVDSRFVNVLKEATPETYPKRWSG